MGLKYIFMSHVNSGNHGCEAITKCTCEILKCEKDNTFVFSDDVKRDEKFFENNLNVSETSRKLFVHRNTLVYRLEKIKKLTGLDLREFDHAIIFKIALMVKKYLSANPVKF